MKALALVILSAIALGPALAQQVEYVTSDYWIGTRNIDIFSGKIYVSFINGFKYYELSGLSNPTAIGQYFCENGGGPIEAASGYVYIINGENQLRIVDVTVPQSPVLAGTYDFAHEIIDMYPAGRYLFLAGGPLDIVDLIDFANPALIAVYESEGDIIDIEIAGDYAYLANGLGIEVVSISDLLNPVLLGSYHSPGFASAVDLQGNYVYAATDSGLEILLVSNPRQPDFMGRHSASCRHVIIDGPIAYTTWGGTGTYLNVIDIQNIYQPSLLGRVVQWGQNDFALADTLVFSSAGYAGLGVISVADSSRPLILNNLLPDSATTEAVAIGGNTAFVGGSNVLNVYDAEIRAIVISDPRDPVRAGSLTLSGFANSLFSTDTLLFMNGIAAGEGFGIINTTDRLNPYLMGEMRGFNYPKGVFARGDYAYFVCNYCWIEMPYGSINIVDISDPAQPLPIYEQSSNPCGHGIQIRDNFLYVAGHDVFSGPARLDIFDITDPVSPDSMGWVEYDGDAWNFVVRGNYIYLAGEDLYAIDISNLLSPVYLGTWPTPGRAVDLCAAGNYLFVADFYSGVPVFDISDPANPILTESFETPGVATDIESYGGYIYVADYYSMIVLGYEPLGVGGDEPLPGDAISLRNYPNPFNARTTISFTLPENSHVRIDLYDLLGRRVDTAIDEHLAAGHHSLVWDANRFDSGIYFYRIKAGTFTESQKMTLLK
jgi:hypothetical protein